MGNVSYYYFISDMIFAFTKSQRLSPQFGIEDILFKHDEMLFRPFQSLRLLLLGSYCYC